MKKFLVCLKFLVCFMCTGFCYAAPPISDSLLEDTSRPHTPIQTHRSRGSESLVIGGMAGAIETVVNYPLWVWKTRAQYGASITFDPRLMYKGVGSRMIMMSGLTASRLTVRDELINFCYNPSKLTLTQNLLTSFAGGFLSAPFSSTTELINIQQQIHHNDKDYKSFISAARKISRSSWTCFGRGLAMGSIRDGIIAGSVFALTPEFSHLLSGDTQNNDSTRLVAGLGSGFTSAVLSHPFDTVKSIQQATPPHEKSPLFWKVGKSIIEKDGWNALYRGFFWRTTRLVIAAPLIFYSTEFFTKIKQGL